jgi:heavy metal translocating P-type ATPase
MAKSTEELEPQTSAAVVPGEHLGTHEQQEEHENPLNWRELSRVLFVLVAAAAIWPFRGSTSPYITAIGVVCTVIGAFPIFAEACENIVQRRMTMELSMAIAVVAAVAIREIFTALVITLFVLVAEILEHLTVGRGRRAIQGLLTLLPNVATVRKGDSWQDEPIEQVEPGDLVMVRPGSRIPVDGTVVAGSSFVDQSAITGESLAAEKVAGSSAYAGTINQMGVLEIQVQKVGRDTTYGRIINEVERAERSRAPIQKLADKLAGYLVYFALSSAAVTFVITHNVRSTISVVIVAGACGIAAGTPLAILGGIGRAARQGVIVKGGRHLESLAQVDTVLLDKTGTLSFGTPEIAEIRPVSGVSPEMLLSTAAIAESCSEHPVAKAIRNRFQNLGKEIRTPETFEYRPGKGIVAKEGGETIVIGNRVLFDEQGVNAAAWNSNGQSGEVGVSRAGEFLGSIRIGDTLRPESREAIRELKEMGLRTVLVTGDSRAVGEPVGAGLGVDEVAAELLPEQKLQWVKQLAAQGRKVAMIGDGVNDAPALLEANVGVAMGSGTDVARESADVVLIGNDLSKFVEALRIARRCRRIIFQNFAGTLLVDAVGICLAAIGLLNPLLAASIHVTSELAFILNSARLLPSGAGAKP